ncbi:MAG: PAS domain S-box protein [Desulfitobacteriaceae bacterium]
MKDTFVEKEFFLNSALFQNIVEQARDIIIIYDVYGNVLYANHAAANAYGYSDEEFHNIRVRDLRSPETRNIFDSQWEMAYQKGILLRTVHMRRDGETFPVEVNSQRICFAQEEFLISIIRDISETVAVETALKRSEEKYRVLHEDLMTVHEELSASEEELRQQLEALRVSEEKFSKVFHVCPDMIAITRLKDGLYVDVNPGYTREAGCTKEEIIGKTSLELGIWVDLQDRERLVEGLKSNGEVRNLESSFRRQDGSILYGLMSARMIDIGSDEYLLIVTRNITERKEMENQLRQNEERFRNILNNLPVAVSYCDKVGNTLFMNQKLVEVFGYSIEDTPTLKIWNEKTLPDEGYRRTLLSFWLDEINKYKRGLIKEPVTLFGWLTCHDGTIKYIEATTILDSEFTYTVFNDITKRKRVEEALKISERKYRTIFEAANDGIFLLDLITGDIVDVNEKACTLWGYTRKEILSPDFNLLETREPPYNKVNGQSQLFEWQSKHKDGHYIPVEVNYKRTAIGNEEYILAIMRDISERKKAEIELQKSQANNEALIRAIPDAMFIIRGDGTFIDFKASKQQPEFLPNSFLGKIVSEVFPAEIADKITQAVKITIMTGDIQIFEYQLSVFDRIEHYEIRIVCSGENEVLAISRNITDRKQIEEQLKHLSLHDSLTQLYNRTFFEEQTKRLQRERDSSAGLLICDVNGLKIVNDTLGHSMGDVILQVVAEILKNSFRPGDLVARIGGDEFAILLPTNSIKELAASCNRIRERINRYNAENPTVPISLSVGYAVSRQTPVDIVALFKEADNYMYREKLHQKKSARNAIVQALMKALEVRDFLTEGHSDRLQDLILSFANTVDIPENSIADLRLLAQFHDIGKVGIPDSILFKPSSLTEEEWVVMRRHCEIGYRIAMSAPDLEPIANWILKHQEWWNGGGYPFELNGEDIPLECRILAIVDAYDAMTSDRPYRKGMSSEIAIAELKRCAGTQFDPELVEQFTSMLLV